MSDRYVVELRLDVMVIHPDYDAIDVKKTVELPFLPRVGDRLALGAGGDFIAVKEIFFAPPMKFDIWCEPESDSALFTEQLFAEGWEKG